MNVLKNHKGFTLVELIATIAVLSLLSTVTVIAVESIFKKGKDRSTSFQKELIIEGAKQYYIDEGLDDACIIIYKDNLIDNNYLEDKDNSLNFSTVKITNDNDILTGVIDAPACP